MRKSADVVTHMQPSSNYRLLFPSHVDWDKFCTQRADVPFSNSNIEYLNALSASLLKDRESRLYPDVITFAFFCRKGNLLKLKEEYTNEDLRLGRGIAFHIAPSNVPINFGYSVVSGMLAGNNNIVRVSSKEFPQVDLIIRHMLEMAIDEKWSTISQKNVLVKYDRTSDATAYFSSIANTRIIWGGDATINSIRQNQLPPRSYDICFADRYSICVIHPEAIMAAGDEEMKKLAENFYNDTYLFDQNACSAPHIVFWQKYPQVEKAKEKFWIAIHTLVSKKYNLQAVLSVDKLTAFYRQAACLNIKKEQMSDNFIVRTQLGELPKNIDAFRCAGGFFSEYNIDSLNDIEPIISNKYQTLAYYGFAKEDMWNFVSDNHLYGLDRIVPVGETAVFSLTWDGYNLIEMMSRIITVN